MVRLIVFLNLPVLDFAYYHSRDQPEAVKGGKGNEKKDSLVGGQRFDGAIPDIGSLRTRSDANHSDARSGSPDYTSHHNNARISSGSITGS